MTTLYSQPNPGNALASENKSRIPFDGILFYLVFSFAGHFR
jgi:hypothetical protein